MASPLACSPGSTPVRLYAYVFGTVGGSLLTSSTFMAVQATGAMAIVIADVPAMHAARDPVRALFTLSLLTGVVMLAAGLLRLGSVLVPDFRLGPPGDLALDPLTARSEADRDRSD